MSKQQLQEYLNSERKYLAFKAGIEFYSNHQVINYGK